MQRIIIAVITLTIFWMILNIVPIATQGVSPNYSVYKMPETKFDCRHKVVGGYYADPEASCQMFHVCVQVSDKEVRDFRFLCPNDTKFDQANFICANWWEVDCGIEDRPLPGPVAARTSTTAPIVSSTSEIPLNEESPDQHQEEQSPNPPEKEPVPEDYDYYYYEDIVASSSPKPSIASSTSKNLQNDEQDLKQSDPSAGYDYFDDIDNYRQSNNKPLPSSTLPPPIQTRRPQPPIVTPRRPNLTPPPTPSTRPPPLPGRRPYHPQHSPHPESQQLSRPQLQQHNKPIPSPPSLPTQRRPSPHRQPHPEDEYVHDDEFTFGAKTVISVKQSRSWNDPAAISNTRS